MGDGFMGACWRVGVRAWAVKVEFFPNVQGMETAG